MKDDDKKKELYAIGMCPEGHVHTGTFTPDADPEMLYDATGGRGGESKGFGANSQAFRDNWDQIFGSKQKSEPGN